MKHILRALAFALGLLPLAAMAQAPPNLPANSVWGRLGFPGTVGPSQQVPFSTLATQVVSPFLPYVQPETYGAKRDGTTDDTAAINAAISAAAASHRGVLLSGGGSYCVRPITITDAGGSMPAFFSGQPASQAALLACNTSSSPTLTLSAFSFNGFVAENFRVNSFSKHATGILITKFIRGRVRNISATGATGAGFKFLGVGTPAGNIEYSSFRDLLSIANGGIGFDFESDATCQPGSCIAANDFSNLSAYTNGSDGYFVDYASIHCKNCEAEGNSGFALNLSHTYVGNWDGFYAELNTLGGPNATASTFGISMIGARLGDTTGIGVIGTALTTCTTCLIDYEGQAFGSRGTNFGAFSAQSANVAGGMSAGGSALFTGDFNVATGGGYRINGGATANHPLCGNAGGTKYVDCPTIPNSVVAGLAASATTDTTNAANISGGTLANGRYAAVNLAAGNVNGGVTGALPRVNGGGATTVAGEQAALFQGLMVATVTAVNFNSANTDTAIPITLPTGFTRFSVFRVNISHASQTLTTSTFGAFSTTGGGGLAIVNAATANTVSSASDATLNNEQTIAGNAGTMVAASLPTPSTIYFRVGTAQGAAATGDVEIYYLPAP